MRERERRSLWYVGEGQADLWSEALPVRGKDDVLVRTLWSGVSRGTERLVAAGRVPEDEADRMRCPFQEGRFPFPVKYGYAAVGVVEEGPAELAGATVFSLSPHQSHAVLPATAVVPVPSTVPARRAVLAANMETALNAVWDAAIGPADRVVVVGGGIVGILAAVVAAAIPGCAVVLADPAPERRAAAECLGLAAAPAPPPASEADVVIHASATAAGLAAAIAAAGFEARVVELSWYGEGAVPVRLGGAFHSRRLTLLSSQVGHLPPGRRGRWSHRRRLEAALRLLADDRLDRLLDVEVAFESLPERLPALLAPGAPGLGIAVRYGQ